MAAAAGTKKRILGACLGDCVHVSGILSFLDAAKSIGFDTLFLGPATPVDRIVDEVGRQNPDIVALSYRLTPGSANELFTLLIDRLEQNDLVRDRRYVLGCTPDVLSHLVNPDFFEKAFVGGESPGEITAFLLGRTLASQQERDYPQNLADRITWKHPYPLIRCHYGLPSLEATYEGIQAISDAEVLDILSLGTDQGCQEFFFHPERMGQCSAGAGGTPVRSEEDYAYLYAAARRGNFPLMRAYAGTNDHVRHVQVHMRTINICFPAIPLFWFNELDGRSDVDLTASIRSHHDAIRFCADHQLPVEINEPHHWSLRRAPDHIFAATAYLGAYTAKHLGIRDFVLQLMFNCPRGVSFKMDLAKMLASLELASGLADSDFKIIVETRSGLPSFPLSNHRAMGQLASSTMLQMSLKPQIVHVVPFCEAHHIADSGEIIESCQIAEQVIRNCVDGIPDCTLDPDVQKRKREIVADARLLLDGIRKLGSNRYGDPLLSPSNLASALRLGLLNAPDLSESPYVAERMSTSIVDGACVVIDPGSRQPLPERERLDRIWRRIEGTT